MNRINTKLLSGSLALSLTLLLAACAGSPDVTETATNDGSIATTETVSEQTDDTETNGVSETDAIDETDGTDGPGELYDITFSLDWTPNTNHSGLYAAIAEGYFEEAGLNVEVVQPAESSAVTLVASSQAHFGVDAQDTMAAALSIDQPLEVTAVATILQHNTSGIIGRAGEGLDGPSGLAGKRYSTWNNPIELAMIESLVAANGADFSDVQLIPNTITDEVAALRADQTDAVWIFYGWTGINAEIQDFDFDYFNFSDLDPVFDYYTPVIIAHQDFLAAEPEIARNFLAALSRGYDFAVENPEAAARHLIEADNTGSLADAEELVLASQNWISGQYRADSDQWGVIDADRWDAFYSWLFEEGLIENELEAGSGFTNEFLPD